jgi:dolichyl-phosphate-mannose-protein mannosyltransferase
MAEATVADAQASAALTPPAPDSREPSATTRTREPADVLVPVALVLGTAALRVPRLGTPTVLVFDEIYYALDAGDLLRQGVEQGAVVHPPLAKWLIAAGIQFGGFTPWGWRAAALVAGCLTVLATYLAARQVVAGRTLPALAATAVALDGVAFTTGRLALLDGFVALFITVAVAFVLAAYRRPDDSRWVRRCQLGAAIALGLGLASKWTALGAIAAVLIAFLALVRATPGGRRDRRAMGTVATFVAVPLGIYLLAYVPWFINTGETHAGLERCDRGDEECALSLLDRADAWFEDQGRMIAFHRDLRPDNAYAAPAWTWALQSQPVVLFDRTCGPDAPPPFDDGVCGAGDDGKEVSIVVVGNPAVWWGALIAGGVLAVRAIRRRDITARLLLGLGLALWLPWMATGRDAFLFYAAPLVPVLALWLAVALARRRARLAVAIVAAIIVVVAAFLYPVWVGTPLGAGGADVRQFWEVW